MIRRIASIGSALVLAFLCGYSRGPLILGPGFGVRTQAPAMVRPLRDDVTVIPIITVGDSLAPPDTVTFPYRFAPEPDGIGVRQTERGLAEVYVAHKLSWHDGYTGALVSRLAIDLRNLGVIGGDYLMDGTEGYSRLCAASRRPAGRISFASVPRGARSLEVFAVGGRRNRRAGRVCDGPPLDLGHFTHENTIDHRAVSSGKSPILTEDFAGQSQLYMYLSENDTDFLAGRGGLYVFRLDTVPGRNNSRLSSMVTKSRPGSGRFVPVGNEDMAKPAVELPGRLEARAQGVGCLNFVRLEDAAPDRQAPNGFYFVDTGADYFYDPIVGRTVTGTGRLYFARLDPFDPTHVEELRVVLDGDEGDDIYRPDNIDCDDRYVWIQEDPEVRGLHPARILRYDTQTRRIDPMAECAEADSKGRMLAEGVGGEWESTGIVDASSIFGPDSWLLTVQAHNLPVPQFGNRRGSGQLLLLRGPGYPRPKRD